MFGTKVVTEDIPQDVDPVHVSQTIKVLQIDFKPSKAEKQLIPWIEQGWTLKSTEAAIINGTTMFILAFLERS